MKIVKMMRNIPTPLQLLTPLVALPALVAGAVALRRHAAHEHSAVPQQDVGESLRELLEHSQERLTAILQSAVDEGSGSNMDERVDRVIEQSKSGLDRLGAGFKRTLRQASHGR